MAGTGDTQIRRRPSATPGWPAWRWTWRDLLKRGSLNRKGRAPRRGRITHGTVKNARDRRGVEPNQDARAGESGLDLPEPVPDPDRAVGVDLAGLLDQEEVFQGHGLHVADVRREVREIVRQWRGRLAFEIRERGVGLGVVLGQVPRPGGTEFLEGEDGREGREESHANSPEPALQTRLRRGRIRGRMHQVNPQRRAGGAKHPRAVVRAI